jgi:N-acetylglucosamine-6-phosphate deacetylase
MRTHISGGTLVTPHEILREHTLVIEEDTILAVEPNPLLPEPEDVVIDATRKWVCPGLIDLHGHGAMGVNVMEGRYEDVHQIAKFYAKHGVTAYLPSTWSAGPEQIMRAITSVATCPQFDDGAQHLGIHVEGPYLNPDHRGAQPREVIRKPDPAEYEAWLETGIVRLVTIAPEIEGALEFIDMAVPQGVEFAIGHSGASYEEVVTAADHGVRQVTHLFNGMLGLHHRRPGTLGGCLVEDRLYVQIIADGIHVHPEMIKLAVRVKPPGRVILITDAIRGAGMPDGDYDFGGQIVSVRDGVSRTPEGGLAGSTLTMDHALRNVMSFTGLPLNKVLPMATSVPAEAMGLADEKGSLRPGADADIVLLDRGLHVDMTMIGGRVVYERVF